MHYFVLILLSAIKFAIAVPVGIFTYKLNFVESVVVTMIGGILGVFFFAFLTDIILRTWRSFFGDTRYELKLRDYVFGLFRKKRLLDFE